ncbi:hypothetical protein DAI18_12820 [Microvirgula aerodenitrificans]|uniref:Uncharacterized protein n=1 Tax=Microvirgula aerodenitrificans TaxID=57480 RepID=A0A2S0PBX4_9NEIS|nr:hypothetical protein DAI18_12820 [Microvirgula aerodenitrificans]
MPIDAEKIIWSEYRLGERGKFRCLFTIAASGNLAAIRLIEARLGGNGRLTLNFIEGVNGTDKKNLPIDAMKQRIDFLRGGEVRIDDFDNGVIFQIETA